MRSKIVIVATVVASLVLAAQMAAADQVQEQLRLMEQRMAEMEDRLQATSDELKTAKATVDEQQGLLSEAGLVELEDTGGFRAGVGDFLKETEFSGLVAADYNYRFMGSGDNNSSNVGLFRHADANNFQFSQFWLTLDNAPNEEKRGGMHVELIAGETAEQFLGSGNNVGVYTAYASYLAPIGNGVQIDAGKLATPLGAEVLQTDQNYFTTTGLVWNLQPVTHTGVSLSTGITDEISVIFGLVNDVYSETNVTPSRDLAYYGQVSYSGESFGLNVGAILGKDDTSGLINEAGDVCDSGDECKTSVFNVVATADPMDNLSLWMDYTWVRRFGDDIGAKGDAHGIAVAGRYGITDKAGLASRVEYVLTENDFNRAGDSSSETVDVVSWTLTGDYSFTDCLKMRLEGRLDTNLSNSQYFANGSNNSGTPGSDNLSERKYQLVGLWEMIYSF